MAIRSGQIEGATKGNALLKELLLDIVRHLNKISEATGIEAVPGIPTSKISPPPQVKEFCVIGSLGLFVASVIPADNITGPVYYTYQSSQTLPFETSTTLIDHGPTPQTSIHFALPGEFRYWRVLSKYASSQNTSPFTFPEVVFSGGVDFVDGGMADSHFEGVIIGGKAKVGKCIGTLDGGVA